MEDILYINSATDVRTKEMVTKTESSKYKTNGYSYVDLGLPSGTLWATMNVGAQSETDHGLYFAWGETQGYNVELLKGNKEDIYRVTGGKSFDLAHNKYTIWDSRRQVYTYTKYKGEETILDISDDAAAANMGGDWHMPSIAQITELLNEEYVTHQEVQNYNNSGINGVLFTSTSDTSKKLFIPIFGFCQDIDLINHDSLGCILSNQLEDTNNVNTLTMGEKGINIYYQTRYLGFNVRGVIGNVQQEQEDDNGKIYNPQPKS